SPRASEIRPAAPANPLAFTCPFYQTGGRKQHQSFCSEKTNLSLAKENLKNAADAVDRMCRLKDDSLKADRDLDAHRCSICNSRSVSVCNCGICGQTDSEFPNCCPSESRFHRRLRSENR